MKITELIDYPTFKSKFTSYFVNKCRELRTFQMEEMPRIENLAGEIADFTVSLFSGQFKAELSQKDLDDLLELIKQDIFLTIRRRAAEKYLNSNKEKLENIYARFEHEISNFVDKKLI